MIKDMAEKNMVYDSQDYARLVRAIMMDTVADIQKVIGQQPLGHFTDDTGRNPLHIAALHDRRNAMEPLIQAGVDPNQVSGDGQTALDIAADQDPAFYQQMIKMVKNEQQRKVRQAKAGQAKTHQAMAKTPFSFKKTIVPSTSKLYGDDR